MQGNPLITNWYYHLPNFVLAAIMYTMLGRLVLSFVFPAGSQNYIWRAFVRITDPTLRLVRFLTPAMVPYFAALIFAFLWLMLARVALFIVMFERGLLKVPGG